MTDTLDRREFAAILAAPIFAPALSILSVNRSPRPAAVAMAPINAPNPDFLKCLGRLMEIAGVPGVGVSVVQDRRLVWQHHQGVMDVTSGQPVSAETMWPAASLSKPVFTLAALRLVDEGKLDLD